MCMLFTNTIFCAAGHFTVIYGEEISPQNCVNLYAFISEMKVLASVLNILAHQQIPVTCVVCLIILVALK